jgi:hypothetical protein
MVEQFVRDDPARSHVRDLRCIHFRNDQWNVRVVAKARGVVDDDATRRRSPRRILAGHRPARRKQGELHPAEIELGEIADRELGAVHPDPPPGGPRARECVQAPDRKSPLLENSEHRLADQAGGADYGDVKRCPPSGSLAARTDPGLRERRIWPVMRIPTGSHKYAARVTSGG